MKLIVASKRDLASINIANKIIENYQFEASTETFEQNPIYKKQIGANELLLIFLNNELVQAQYVTNHFKPELIVFISRHSSESGNPTLSVHTPGNLGKEAKLGGLPRKVSISPANAMKNALQKMAQLKEERKINYEVCYEGTHHGPSLDTPTMFAELGSSPTQWKDQQAAEIVAHATIAAATKETSYPATIGIGGPHYNEKFTKIALIKPTAFSHIIPKYAVPWMDSTILRQCIERTVEKVESITLDWKGIRGEDKQKLMMILSEIDIQTEKL
jgi:D-aminoacyl-tRNA deacylase